MNVLFLMGTYPNFGGVEVVSTILANEFVKRGYGVSIVSFDQPRLDKEPMTLDDRVHFYPLTKPAYSKDNIAKLHDILVAQDVDVLINQWVVPYYVARLCYKSMKGTKCKMIGVHHNLPNHNHQIEQVKIALRNHEGNVVINRVKLELITLVSRLSLRYTISKCTRYLTLSPSYIPIAERYTWMKNGGKFEAIANPLTIDSAGQENLYKKNEIIYVGRIEYNQKCTYRIVDIWKRLEEKYPDWCIKIVGDGPDRPDMQRRIEEAGLKHITIEGFQNPLPYYKEAKILLLVSAYEGFPLVLAEAMEYGVVPISFDSYAAVHDIIDNGQNGYIVPKPYSDEAFVDVLERLLNDENEINETSKASRAKSAYYSLESVIAKWEGLLHTITK